MDGHKRQRLESALRGHYASLRPGTNAPQVRNLTAAMVAEDRRFRRGPVAEGGTLPFVASQVRYIPAWVWIAQAALVVLMMILAATGYDGLLMACAVGMLSAMTVLVGVPVLGASRACAMAELEYACRNNAARVVVARLIVLGCSSALCSLAMVIGVARFSGLGALSLALWSCPPYFVSCAGALYLLRKLRTESALTACVAWVLSCCGALLALEATHPELYTQTSLAVWLAAAGLALAWLVREAVLTIRAAAVGLDAFSPQLARTYN